MPKDKDSKAKKKTTVAEAIAQFEVRIGGLMPEVGEKVEVKNVRARGDAYVANIVRYHSKDSKERWQMKQGQQVQLVAVQSEDVLYNRDYMDFLASHPVYNEAY